MKALLVYESMFGNTEQIARAVAEGLSRRLPGGDAQRWAARR